MAITSFSYFIFIAILMLIYYMLPQKIQWIELLVASIIFYCFVSTPYTYCYIIMSTIMAWGVTTQIGKYRETYGQQQSSKILRVAVMVSIIIDIVLWFVIKGNSLITDTQSILGKLFPSILSIEIINLTAALGMGYYTLQIIGYTLDCYWGIVEVQKNPFKLLLFTSFFPQMTTGPISHYSDLISLFERHSFSYINLAHGVQRIMWGLFKKMVVADRAGIIVNTIWTDFSIYNGVYLWIALLLYPIQMYADFSGCMDIVIGTAEIFDIKLIENFNNPFFSRTSQEFWQRWHISLGTWAKDYILYPVLKSKFLQRLNKILKMKYGKKVGKFITTSLGMLVLWFVMGAWHGAFKYIVGVSLWYWIILIVGDLTASILKEVADKWQLKTDTFGWRFFQAVRTYFIYAVGAAFFRSSDIKSGFSFIGSLFAIFENWNPWILFDGSIETLGVSFKDINVLIIAVILMLIVGIVREKYGYARNWLDKQPVLFRWSIYLCLFFGVLIFGRYGPDYVSSNFIYGDF